MKKIICLLAVSMLMSGCMRGVQESDYDKGIKAAGNKQYEQAIGFFIKSAGEEKDKNVVASSFYNIGFCYGILKDFDKEVEYYKKALEASSVCQPALYDLGLYYKKNGDIENSLKMFETLAEVNPKHEDAFYMIGSIYYETGNKEEALKNLRKAADLGSPEAKEMLAAKA